MKKLPAAVLSLVLLLSSCPAGAAQETPVFLWSVTGKGGTVHLLGSVHVLKPDSYPLDRRITDAYGRSKRVMFEADMREMTRPEVHKALLDQGTYREGTLLKDHVSAKTYGLLQQKLASAGLPESRFERYKPWLCAVSLSGVELARLGFDPKWGIDAHFYALARRDGKETLFLETALAQIQLLSKTLSDRQEDLLRQSLRELEVIGLRSEELRRAWRRGDAAKLEGITSVSLREYPMVRDALFTQRNVRWLSKIEELMGREGDSLVVVGAGHLVGREGVISLLQGKGYRPVQQ